MTLERENAEWLFNSTKKKLIKSLPSKNDLSSLRLSFWLKAKKVKTHKILILKQFSWIFLFTFSLTNSARPFFSWDFYYLVSSLFNFIILSSTVCAHMRECVYANEVNYKLFFRQLK